MVGFKEDRSHHNTRLRDLHDALFSNKPRNILELGEFVKEKKWFKLDSIFWIGAGIGIVSVVLGVLRSGLIEEGNQDRILTTDVREFYSFRAESPSKI